MFFKILNYLGSIVYKECIYIKKYFISQKLKNSAFDKGNKKWHKSVPSSSAATFLCTIFCTFISFHHLAKTCSQYIIFHLWLIILKSESFYIPRAMFTRILTQIEMKSHQGHQEPHPQSVRQEGDLWHQISMEYCH